MKKEMETFDSEAEHYFYTNKPHVEEINGESFITVGPPTGRVIAHIDPNQQWPDGYCQTFANCLTKAWLVPEIIHVLSEAKRIFKKHGQEYSLPEINKLLAELEK